MQQQGGVRKVESKALPLAGDLDSSWSESSDFSKDAATRPESTPDATTRPMDDWSATPTTVVPNATSAAARQCLAQHAAEYVTLS